MNNNYTNCATQVGRDQKLNDEQNSRFIRDVIARFVTRDTINRSRRSYGYHSQISDI